MDSRQAIIMYRQMQAFAELQRLIMLARLQYEQKNGQRPVRSRSMPRTR